MMPFLKIPIVLPGNPEDIREPDKEVTARIVPVEIESFNDAYHWGALIKFKSGEIIMTTYTADQVEEVLAKYWHELNERVKKQQQQQPSNLFLYTKD